MNLKSIRNKIDALDSQLIKLLNERAVNSQKIGRLKRDEKQSVYSPDREREVIQRLCRMNRGPITKGSIEAIYREIMSSSLSLEKQISIAYLGPQYTFTHQASVKKFGQSVQYVPCTGISDIFLEVESGRCDYGVAPIENSTEGAIYHTLDSFIDSDLKICSEVMLTINLDILSREKNLKRIKRVYSNPQVFGQCRQWLETYLPVAELVPVSSTARGAAMSAVDKGTACIASALAAQGHNLRVLASSIQDSMSNVTRFMVLSRESAKPTKNDKTSIVLSIKDRAGALQNVLEPFRKYKINLTKIESRPSKRKQWDYYFFVDLEAHVEEKRVRAALKAVESRCAFLKILGSYPKAG